MERGSWRESSELSSVVRLSPGGPWKFVVEQKFEALFELPEPLAFGTNIHSIFRTSHRNP